MNKRWIAAACLAGSLAAWVVAQEQAETLPLAAGPTAPPADLPPTDERHYSYAIGMDVGASFRDDDLKLDIDSLVAGLRDGLAGAEPKYSPELCRAAVQKLSQQRMDMLDKRNADYLVENAKKPGVQTTPSGLQYKVLASGDGPSPTPADTVKVHYEGRLIDDSVFDSTLGGEPATLEVGRVIPGWTEAMQKMKVGDKWQLVIPSKLGYEEPGAGDVIPPNATLIFEVELLGIEK